MLMNASHLGRNAIKNGYMLINNITPTALGQSAVKNLLLWPGADFDWRAPTLCAEPCFASCTDQTA